jgi:DNA-binding CsgD family transcriptional regulator/tetratricopeptide (TPR) repeat protein
MNPSSSRSGFIGRQRELDTMRSTLAASMAGRLGIVLLAGEPGIGKSRAAQEIAEQAGQRGVLALSSRCPEEPGAPPYWPWLQLARRYVALTDEALAAKTIGRAGPFLAALDPELADSLSDVDAAPAETDVAKARFLLFDALAAFWRRAAAHQPLLLVIDDLHRADLASLRLLEFVVADAASADSRIMLLGTYRDAEITREHPLSNTLVELSRSVAMQRLVLGGFSADETAQFVSGATGVASAEIAVALHERTDGHPLFLIELARSLGAGDATPAVTRGTITHLPRGVREVIGARLNRLTPPCVQALQCAAVIGREFRFDVLRVALEGQAHHDSPAMLDEARAASLIAEFGEPGQYQFAHALVRDVLYDELPAAQRAQLHLRVGRAFESLHAGDLTPCLSALAHHHHAAGAAGEPAKAIEFAVRAAERASAMQAHEEAARHYLRAIAALAPVAAQDALRCRLLLGLGRAQNSAGASAVALSTFADAATCARRIGDVSLLAQAAIGFGDSQWRLGSEGSKAVALIREALTQAPPPQDRERCALLTALCQALLFSDQPDAAEQAFREAVALARDIGEPPILFRALCAILPGRWYPDRLALRIAVAREAIELVKHAGKLEWLTPYLSGWHTGDLMESGDTVGASATARAHLLTGEAMREPFNEAVALAALAMIATHEGRFVEAEPLAMQALRCGTRFDRANAAGIFGVQMFTLRRHQGRLGELAPVLRQFLDREAPGAAWRPGLAVLHCELGDLDAARSNFEALAAADFGTLPRDAIRIASLAYLAEVCVALDDRPRAAVLFDLLLPYAGRNIVFGAHTASLGSADRLLGLLAMTMAQWDRAEQHLERAIAFDERTGGRPWLARSRVGMATLLLRRTSPGPGDTERERARALLVAARDDARLLGMDSVADEALRLMPHSSAAPGLPPAGLSAREIEVLRMVAIGKTNQQIAAALFRSPNTVANHVRNILGKTQAANRTEAAAFAVRHGLLPPQ